MGDTESEIEQSSDTVISADGTQIEYLTVGDGPAVIVVPGALSVAAGFARFAGALSTGFTVHTIQRRGRGGSGPQSEHYTIAEDRADVEALQAKTGAALLVGHSYGGLVALESARGNSGFTKLALYEPGVSIAGSLPTEWMSAYEKYLAEDKPFDAFVEFVRALGPDLVRKMPRWMFRSMMTVFMKAPEKEMVFSQLEQNLREHREIVRLDDTYSNYAEITAATLLLDGDKDRHVFIDPNHELLASTLPHCERHTIAGVDHFGMDKGDPERVAGVVGEFFSRK
ncbi:alpha/beta fold hydrolase [Nocardia sp. NPDC057668]|uniref:alpha/beta fold hydrolase n=1 Tax=Nocardia sp. NPDC057668 TaxID=3346202 RepID=UPI003672CC6C